jgi:hypothetical protein
MPINWKWTFDLPVNRYVRVSDECTTVCTPWRGKLGTVVNDYASTYDLNLSLLEEDDFTPPECTAFLVVDGCETERIDFRVTRNQKAERI